MITLCSDQDFSTKMARFDAVLLQCNLVMNQRPNQDTMAARNDALHRAMGYRADQPEY